MFKAINKEHIEKIKIIHEKNEIDLILNNQYLYKIDDILKCKNECEYLFENSFKANIKYDIPVKSQDDRFIKTNLLTLLKVYCNSLAKDLREEDISLKDSSRAVVKICNKILYDKIMKNRIGLSIKEFYYSIYKQPLDFDLEYDESIYVNTNLNIEKELNNIIKENYAKSIIDNDIKKSIKNISVEDDKIIIGKKIVENPVLIENIEEMEGMDYVLNGDIISIEVKDIKKDLSICQIDITDYTSSISIKSFVRKQDAVEKLKSLGKGESIIVKGKMNYDSYSKEFVILANSINKIKKEKQKDRMDLSKEKRLELHVHSKMSSMDGISDFDRIVKRAKEWGHKAIAITDHGVLQGYPEAMESAKKHGIKVIYGVEGYLADDGVKVINNPIDADLNGDFIVFDLETTGLSPIKDKIIEIGAVKISNYKIVDEFNLLVNPGINIPAKITEITGISDNDVKNSQNIDYCMEEFLKFIGDTKILCAHNASFDYSFLRVNMKERKEFCVLDTLELSRCLIKNKKSHKLNKVCEYLNISLENHHRASDDAKAAGEILIKFFEILEEKGIENIKEINAELAEESNIKNAKTYHIIILVKNYIGLKNLYKLVSEAHMNYFYKKPRIPKSILNQYREGLILGSACEAGELYKAILTGSSDSELDNIAAKYDFIEVQPLSNNMHLVKNGTLKTKNDLIEINKKIIDIGKRNNKIICATGDVHFLDEKDSITREILMAGQGYDDAEDQAPLYFKTTEEMKNDFSYLEEELCNEIVIDGPNKIADMIDEGILPIPDGTYPPIIEGSDENLRKITMDNAYRLYGDPLPEIVEKRLERELNSIISNGYAVMYIIAQKLVEKSLLDGYLVGSRGSVGSSFAATMSNITEVNPLPPHYLCKNCKKSEFILDGSYGSGVDLPDKNCPECGKNYTKDGHDIPFEVFLGFEGDKEPDIDLNFAAKEQIEAMKYSEELFGEGYVFRAGTIGTIASKTAYGFVKNYFDNKNIRLRNAEINRLVDLCTGVRRTTGQHPGGVMIVPRNKEIYDFTPIQYPANNSKTGVITTHFDYHSISGRILKLDILGHDTPTIIKMLEDFTGVSNYSVPLDDKATLSLFNTPDVLGVKKEDINCDTGTLGIPEFGTGFVRQMLLDTKPKTFSDLVRISGLSHGTDVWINNAQELVRNGTTTIKNVISTRDDIMTFLIYQGLEKKKAFDIMERVRKGKGLRDDDIEAMKNEGVPQWYIDSCNKIKYMFPKAHAVAYVTMSVKIAYYKVHHPLAFYASYFTMKAMDFDADLIVKGEEAIKSTMKEINLKESKTQKEKNLITVLEVAYEMYKRGFEIDKVDLYESDHKEFKLKDRKLLPPFISLQGLGENAALNIQTEREKSEFISIEDLMSRAKINKTCIEVLRNHGCLEGLSQSNQISLFNI